MYFMYFVLGFIRKFHFGLVYNIGKMNYTYFINNFNINILNEYKDMVNLPPETDIERRMNNCNMIDRQEVISRK